MGMNEKMSAQERQDLIVESLQMTDKPITGSVFASEANVSRQVIVQDISILKAKKYPIIATSRGYLLQREEDANYQKVIAVEHGPDRTEEELQIIVDHGVTVRDVTVEHALYGEITASIMVSNRMEVEQFIGKMKQTKSPYLSTLTDGIHLHQLESDREEKIMAACKSLAKAGILLEE